MPTSRSSPGTTQVPADCGWNRWTCSTCSNVNSRHDLHCLDCLRPKSDSDPVNSTSTTGKRRRPSWLRVFGFAGLKPKKQLHHHKPSTTVFDAGHDFEIYDDNFGQDLITEEDTASNVFDPDGGSLLYEAVVDPNRQRHVVESGTEYESETSAEYEPLPLVSNVQPRKYPHKSSEVRNEVQYAQPPALILQTRPRSRSYGSATTARAARVTTLDKTETYMNANVVPKVLNSNTYSDIPSSTSLGYINTAVVVEHTKRRLSFDIPHKRSSSSEQPYANMPEDPTYANMMSNERLQSGGVLHSDIQPRETRSLSAGSKAMKRVFNEVEQQQIDPSTQLDFCSDDDVYSTMDHRLNPQKLKNCKGPRIKRGVGENATQSPPRRKSAPGRRQNHYAEARAARLSNTEASLETMQKSSSLTRDESFRGFNDQSLASKPGRKRQPQKREFTESIRGLRRGGTRTGGDDGAYNESFRGFGSLRLDNANSDSEWDEEMV